MISIAMSFIKIIIHTGAPTISAGCRYQLRDAESFKHIEAALTYQEDYVLLCKCLHG